MSAEALEGAEVASSWLDSDRLILTAGLKSFPTASSSLSSSPDSAHSKSSLSAAAELLQFQLSLLYFVDPLMDPLIGVLMLQLSAAASFVLE